MNKETRIKKIQEITSNGSAPISRIEIPWQDQLQAMDVYKIPLEYLIYNKYNGRILSRTKSLERQNQPLDPETPEGKRIIESLLFESHKDRNAKTLKSLADFGQQKVGIITKDGIIIDGNRRAMLLNKCEKYDYFKAVVLPVTLEENPLEIEKLETFYQLGEDKKLDYNATEKYIKTKEIYLRLTNSDAIDNNRLDESAVRKIADWMGEQDGTIKEYLRTIVTMDEYLEYWDYDGIYTQLDEREDQFLDIQNSLKNFYGGDSKKAFDGYSDTDVDDLKAIAFDYIRFRPQYDGKLFRLLSIGYRDKHFFGDRDIWNGFKSKHLEIIRSLPQETPIDYNSNNLPAHLNDRDKRFFNSANNEKGKNRFLDNLEEFRERIGNNQAADEPEKLVKRANQSFDSIKTGHKAFSHPDVQNQVLALGEKVFDVLQNKSPSRVLDHIINLLSKFDYANIVEKDKEGIEKKLKRIQQLGYNINKQL